MSDFNLFEGALHALLTGPEVQKAAVASTDSIVELVKQSLSRPYPGGLNPPPGPPYMRSQDLRNSIQATDPTIEGDGVAVGVVATAEHRGVRYGNVLLARGYQFIDPALLGA